MLRHLERRLQRLETAAGLSGPEIWVTDADETLRGPHGERITREVFDRRQLGRRGVIVLSATDSLL
jgi:hypothetical protein